MLRSRLALAILVSGVLLAGACGDDDDDSVPMTGDRPTTLPAAPSTTIDPAANGTFPTTINAANGAVTIDAQPAHIVSLSPTATEMLFAIEAGDQVAAVDEQSDFPGDAPREEDLSGDQPDVEAIRSFEPDLLVVDDNATVNQLAALDVPVLLMPPAASLDDSYQQIEQLGGATGHLVAANELVTSMQNDVAALQAKVPQPPRGIKAYHEVDDSLSTVPGSSFLGQIYQLAGLTNIAADLAASQGNVRISPEQVVADNPDWIFLAYGDHDTVTEVKDRPGWNQIVAVQDDQIVTLDPDIASRWGPRSVDLLQELVQTAYPGT